MKFLESPSSENFVLTNKKKRIIKAFMKEYCFSYNLYYMYRDNGFVPELDDFISFLKNRLIFLKNAECFYAIKTSADSLNSKKFTGVF